MKTQHFYLALIVLWVVFLVYPHAATPFALLVYGCFIGSIGYSAVRYRREGWIAGLFLCILMATIPLWVVAAILLYQSFIYPHV